MIARVATFSIFGGSSEPVDLFLLNALIGYRYQRAKGGFFFRATFDIKKTTVVEILPWAGILVNTPPYNFCALKFSP